MAASISKKIYVNINGIKMGMFIKSKDSGNPVLLYLHGGMPEYFLERKYPTGLEEYFTIVWWEQRGSGLSYSTGILPGKINIEQMISDTIELTLYLIKQFNQDKICLMGHSGGTFIGIQAAVQASELYKSYIGVAQISNQLRSEVLAYEYMLKYYREKGNRTMVRKLEAAPVTMKDGIQHGYLVLRDKIMHRLGIGTRRDMKSVITGIFLPSLTCRDYTLKEKINMWRGKFRSGLSLLWDSMLGTDLSRQVPEIKIPVYFFHGIFDYTVSYTLAKEYFKDLKAPVKGFYTFEKSAHSPMFEEPARVLEILRKDVMTGKNNLADIE